MNKILTAIGFSALMTTALFAAEAESTTPNHTVLGSQEVSSESVIVVTECGHIINTIGEKDSGMSHEDYAQYLIELSESYCDTFG